MSERDYSHLDIWRIKPLGERVYAFGPIHLQLSKLTDKADAFLSYMAATPRHGMFWGDAYALEFIEAPVAKAVQQRKELVNRAYRAALKAACGETPNTIAPLVGSVSTCVWKDKPVFTMHSGSATMDVLLAAMRRGLTAPERKRLNTAVGETWTKQQLAALPDFRVEGRHTSNISITYPGALSRDPHWRLLYKYADAMGAEPHVMPAIGPELDCGPGKSYDASLDFYYLPMFPKRKKEGEQPRV